jgi:hypothetical protein
MLDQNSEEALDGAVQRAMDHQRLVRLAVLANVFQREAARQREIELHGGKLPGAANGVNQFHIDLGAVKCGFVGDHFGLNVEALGGAAQGVFAELPLLSGAVILAARAAIPRGKLGGIFGEAVGGQRVDGELQTIHYFVFDLVRRAENMGVVLRESPHAKEAVEHA